MRLRLALSIVLVEILLLIVVLPLLLAWLIYYRGGFHWFTNELDQKKETFFNLHPLCMVLGFIVVLSQGKNDVLATRWTIGLARNTIAM